MNNKQIIYISLIIIFFVVFDIVFNTWKEILWYYLIFIWGINFGLCL